MLQSVKRGKWKVARSFYKELGDMDNVFLLSMRWIYLKLGRLAGIKIKKANDFLFEDLPPTQQTAMKATTT
jgi:hypothetical protein